MIEKYVINITNLKNDENNEKIKTMCLDDWVVNKIERKCSISVDDMSCKLIDDEYIDDIRLKNLTEVLYYLVFKRYSNKLIISVYDILSYNKMKPFINNSTYILKPYHILTIDKRDFDGMISSILIINQCYNKELLRINYLIPSKVLSKNKNLVEISLLDEEHMEYYHENTFELQDRQSKEVFIEKVNTKGE